MKEIYITFDMDWACDGVLEYLNDILTELDICATINVTHETNMLEVFRKNKKIELGLHPNFNKILDGSEDGGGYMEVIKKLKKIVPEAVSARSHALVEGTPILRGYAEFGINYELNMYIPPTEGTVMMPFESYLGGYRIPFIFEDDLEMLECRGYSVGYYLSNKFEMFKVFNFHPIHLFLNSEKIERYTESKIYYHDFEKLGSFRNNSKDYGTEVFFKQLVEQAEKMNYKFLRIKDMQFDKIVQNKIRRKRIDTLS